ncbi:hypothetical protein [Maribacter halichondriae]|uniref:hypothetical protein n=1 Tax=Maribacter halichondriae TaxID=2980554 RepID=UPI002358D0BC|nr:hypothetical protein [Maribacter sp. Hal144]
MKNNIEIIGLLVCMICSCSKSDDVPIGPPEISYDQTQYKTSFYKAGSSVAPTVDWKGDKGRFGLLNSRKGVSINTETGIINWDKTLPLGSARANQLDVLAYNNAGEDTVLEMGIENKFEGLFKGSYEPGGFIVLGSKFFAEFNFMSNKLEGVLIAEDDNGVVVDTSPIEGSWQREGNIITAEYTFVGAPEVNPRFIKATINYSKTEAYLEGRFGTNLEDNGFFYSEFKFHLNTPE